MTTTIKIVLAEYDGIGTSWGRHEREVMGTLVGRYLAVHQQYAPPKATKPDWRITHLPTGRVVRNGYRSERAALIFARKIQHLDWSGETARTIMDALEEPMRVLMAANPIVAPREKRCAE